MIHFNTHFYNNNLCLIQIREIIFLIRKIVLIAIISFLKIGEGDLIQINNTFITLIILSIQTYFEMKERPYLSDDLNRLGFRGSVIMIITIFGGLFSTISQNEVIQIILMIVIFLLNINFALKFLFKFFLVNFSLSIFIQRSLEGFLPRRMKQYFFENSNFSSLFIHFKYTLNGLTPLP